jgi:hypothetical protein
MFTYGQVNGELAHDEDVLRPMSSRPFCESWKACKTHMRVAVGTPITSYPEQRLPEGAAVRARQFLDSLQCDPNTRLFRQVLRTLYREWDLLAQVACEVPEVLALQRKVLDLAEDHAVFADMLRDNFESPVHLLFLKLLEDACERGADSVLIDFSAGQRNIRAFYRQTDSLTEATTLPQSLARDFRLAFSLVDALGFPKVSPYFPSTSVRFRDVKVEWTDENRVRLTPTN